MRYDLNFWKYEKESSSNNHQAIYERLSNGEFVEGLKIIPIEDILKKINEVFSALGWIPLDEETWESESGAFQIYTTPQFFRIDYYGADEDMEHLINITHEFGLPLYDPQTSKRI
jgi:hypothetical protein